MSPIPVPEIFPATRVLVVAISNRKAHGPDASRKPWANC